jgi:hydrogenase nickel incorporation protein HypA/HybF
MHELAICQALIAQVEALAEARDASVVTDIHVGIGPLSGVEAVLLQDAFPIAAAGTIASAASLHLRRTSVRVHCEECGAETDAKANRLLCGKCEHWRTTLIHGDELLLERVELNASRNSMSRGETANV